LVVSLVIELIALVNVPLMNSSATMQVPSLAQMKTNGMWQMSRRRNVTCISKARGPIDSMLSIKFDLRSVPKIWMAITPTAR